MISSSNPTSKGEDTGLPNGQIYFVDRQARVDRFVEHHFTWPGTLNLYSAALGCGFLRAPINVMLSPVLVMTQIAAFQCWQIRLRRIANWLAGQRILLPTAISRRVGNMIALDLLDLPFPQGSAVRDRSDLRMISMAPGAADAVARTTTIAEFPIGQAVGGLWYDLFPTGASFTHLSWSLRSRRQALLSTRTLLRTAVRSLRCRQQRISALSELMRCFMVRHRGI